MSGARKQTNSSHDSIHRSIIMRMDDGKGIGRRVNQSPHHSEELRTSLKEGSQFVDQPSGANSRLR